MKRTVNLMACTLMLLPAVAFAQAPDRDPSNSTTTEEPQQGAAGKTDAPTAKPEDGKGSLADKAARDNPGSTGGSTGEPTAKPKSGDLPSKAEDDLGKK